MVNEAIVQEHFSASAKVVKGIHLMTMHKSKGKEFDEVIIYEGAFQGKYLRKGANERERAQSLLSLRVAVTRAMKYTTIFTPNQGPCEFL